jgi:motility quorum-sensing regulator / GCU-specific mRNA interferase toxin
MEKRRPQHDLSSIQRQFSSVDGLRLTGTALRGAFALGFDRAGIVATIQRIERPHFYKSMTSYADPRQWQDVYHVPSPVGLLYVKFTAGAVTEYVLLSFKEKDDA